MTDRQISIHALREEGDYHTSSCVTSTSQFLSTPSARRATDTARVRLNGLIHFYPRPPRGGRPAQNSLRVRKAGFLSTPSARRATFAHGDCLAAHLYFYPRPPRGGRLQSFCQCSVFPPISIHALREEGDFTYYDPRLAALGISIHALREEGDRRTSASLGGVDSNFYPRPPRGGRRSPRSRHTRSILYFYPRPPRGGRPGGTDSA